MKHDAPSKAPTRDRWPLFWLGGLALAAAAVLVVYVQVEPPERTGRGGNAAGNPPGTRARCSRSAGAERTVIDPAAGGCLNGDRLSFVVTAPTHRFVAVVVVQNESEVELVVSGAAGALAPGAPEVVLPNASKWAPELRAVAIYGPEPIAPALAERCALKDCPPPLERREIPMGAAAR